MENQGEEKAGEIESQENCYFIRIGESRTKQIRPSGASSVPTNPHTPTASWPTPGESLWMSLSWIHPSFAFILLGTCWKLIIAMKIFWHPYKRRRRWRRGSTRDGYQSAVPDEVDSLNSSCPLTLTCNYYPLIANFSELNPLFCPRNLKGFLLLLRRGFLKGTLRPFSFLSTCPLPLVQRIKCQDSLNR